MKTIMTILILACAGCYDVTPQAPVPEITECVTDEDCAGCVGNAACGECGDQWEYCCAQLEGCRFMACIDGTCRAADETPCQDNAACDAWCIGRDYANGGVRCLGGDPRDYSGACDDCHCYYTL